MTSCLGIYVGENIIKYAKVNKEKDNLKIEAFGVKFYKNLKETIDQIVAETFSNNVPISVNTSNETYDYFYMSNLLNKKDLQKAASTEFESLCYERKVNANALETRYAFVSDVNDKERIKVIHVSTDKISINKTLLDFSGHSISNMSPISLSIPTIAPIKVKENIAIINMDDVATVTILTGEKIFDVQRLSVGAKDVIEKIRENVNSYTKAYEICKNTTIYTNDAKDLQIEENEYLEDIMPTLYNIVTETRQFANESLEAIEKIYITGTLSVINNIDIYFQEYMKSTKCEVLKPYFVSNNSKINIKDYIEVNSAIALAIQAIDGIVKNVNFNKEGEAKKLLSSLNTKVTLPKLNEIDLPNVYENHKVVFDTSAFVSVIILIIYIVITMIANGVLNNKNQKVIAATDDVNSKIKQVQDYNTSLNNRITKYKTLITNIEEDNDKNSENKRYKNTIPNLMNNLMSIIPKEVQLTSIENSNGTHIQIEAKSTKYEQLAFFKTKIKTEGILTNVISDTGVAEGSSIKLVIEGELP